MKRKYSANSIDKLNLIYESFKVHYLEKTYFAKCSLVYNKRLDIVRAASAKSFCKSTHLLLLFGTDDKLRSAALITLSKPSLLIIPSWTAFVAAPTYVLKKTIGLPFISFGGGTYGYGSSETTCKKIALTICGYS